jgi:hypothetical protein
MSTTVRLLVDVKNEKPAYEEVHVEECGRRTYRLLQSPGLVQGLAADDIFILEGAGTYELVRRGGNICIQIYGEPSLAPVEKLASTELAKVGGRLDGEAPRVLVYTVPAAAGFPAIERSLTAIQARFPTIEWYYGNVYDLVDGVTPLNWWLDM